MILTVNEYRQGLMVSDSSLQPEIALCKDCDLLLLARLYTPFQVLVILKLHVGCALEESKMRNKLYAEVHVEYASDTCRAASKLIIAASAKLMCGCHSGQPFSCLLNNCSCQALEWIWQQWLYIVKTLLTMT